MTIIYSGYERAKPMAVKTIYIRSTSKTALNIALARGYVVMGTIYTCDSVEVMRLASMPTGTVVKVFKRTFGSVPVPHTMGVWFKDKGRKGKVI